MHEGTQHSSFLAPQKKDFPVLCLSAVNGSAVLCLSAVTAEGLSELQAALHIDYTKCHLIGWVAASQIILSIVAVLPYDTCRYTVTIKYFICS